MTEQRSDIGDLLKLNLQLLAGGSLSREQQLSLMKELIEVSSGREGARRILARWGAVSSLLEYLERWFTDKGMVHMAEHIRWVLMSMGGQP